MEFKDFILAPYECSKPKKLREDELNNQLSAIFPTLFAFLVELGSWDGKKLSSAAGVFHTCAQPLGIDVSVAAVVATLFIARECLYATQVGYLLVERELGVRMPLRLGATPGAHLVLP